MKNNYSRQYDFKYYDVELLKKIQELAIQGYTNKDIAKKLGYTIGKFEKLINDVPIIDATLNYTRKNFINDVELALYKAAIGLNYEVQTTEAYNEETNVYEQKKRVIKNIPPNINAAIELLKAYKPTEYALRNFITDNDFLTDMKELLNKYEIE